MVDARGATHLAASTRTWHRGHAAAADGTSSRADRRRRDWVDRKQKSKSFDFCWQSGLWSRRHHPKIALPQYSHQYHDQEGARVTSTTTPAQRQHHPHDYPHTYRQPQPQQPQYREQYPHDHPHPHLQPQCSQQYHNPEALPRRRPPHRLSHIIITRSQ